MAADRRRTAAGTARLDVARRPVPVGVPLALIDISVGDMAAVADVARQIAVVLGPHTAVEEHGLFPALAGEFAEQIAVLEAEHRRIEAVLVEAASRVPADPAWLGRLLAVLHLLREHILKEQDGVFPAALATLRTSEWKAVEEVRSRVGSHVPRPKR